MKALALTCLIYSTSWRPQQAHARHLHQHSLSMLNEQMQTDLQLETLVDVNSLQHSIANLVNSNEIRQAKKQTKKIAKQIKALLSQIDSQKQQLAKLKSMQKTAVQDQETGVVENAEVKFGKGMSDPDDASQADDQEKPRDEVQGGEDESEHKDLGEEPDAVDTHGILKEGDKVADNASKLAAAKQKPQMAAQLTVRFSQLEQVQKQINLIAGMIPSIKDQKKRARVIRSIAPVLEDSLDQLLNGLKNGDSMTDETKKTSFKQQLKVVDSSDMPDVQQQETKRVVSNTVTDSGRDIDRDSLKVEQRKQKRRRTDKMDHDGVIRRKQKTTHERQQGDTVERTQHETHEELNGRNRRVITAEDEDEQNDVSVVNEKQRDRSTQVEARQETSVKTKLQERQKLESRLRELNQELQVEQHTSSSSSSQKKMLVGIQSNADQAE